MSKEEVKKERSQRGENKEKLKIENSNNKDRKVLKKEINRS